LKRFHGKWFVYYVFYVLYFLHVFIQFIYKQCIHTGKCFPLVGGAIGDVTFFIKPMCTASQRIFMGTG
jgi:hypothetical protein